MVHSANKSQALIDTTQFPAAKHYFIAYSGGMDSTALLHSLATDKYFKEKLSAIHINHQINPESNIWADHCQNTCRKLGIPFIKETVTLEDHSEMACRQARQNVFKKYLKAKDCLLTAHHSNDQIETILFRLFRGTGLKGMTGMQRNNAFSHYTIHRPLLFVSKNLIKNHVTAHNLSYIEDPSNQDNKYSRNHIRNVIVPLLEQYHPSTLNNIVLTAKNLNHSQQMILHLVGKSNPLSFELPSDENILSTTLYHWLNNHGLAAPSHKRLLQFSQDCILAAEDKNPELPLNNCRITKWKNQLYLLNELPQINNDSPEFKINPADDVITLPDNGQVIIDEKLRRNVTIKIKYQQSRETIKTNQQGPSKKIKNLFQEMSIPPWQRTRMPYLYINNELMAVGSEVISADFKVLLNKYKAEYRWLSPQFLL